MDKLKIIQVGTGGFGKQWVRSVLKVEEVELAAIVDVNEQNLAEAKKLTEGRNVAAYTDYKQAFKEIKADIALLITPPGTHKALTIAAVEAGMHVLMEKPVTAELQEAIELNEYAQQCGKIVMVNQNYRWSPVIQAVKQCADSGVIGPIENVEWHFARNHTNVNFSSGWRSEFDEILLKEMSIHHFDMMRHILGKDPVSVYAESTSPSWSWIKSNAVTSAIINFEGGVFVNYFGSWVSRGKDTPWNGNVRLIGSKGAIVLHDEVPEIIWENGTREPIPVPAMKYSGLEYSIYDLVTAIREQRLPVTHIGDNLRSWSFVCAAVDSAKHGVKIIF